MRNGDDSSDLVLRPLAVDDEDEALAAQDELASEGFEFLPGRAEGQAWADYVAHVHGQEQGEGLFDGHVPATFLVGEVNGQVIGRVSIRHRLNEFLRQVGGHIEFGVRPAWRGRGYATRILLEAMRVSNEMGIECALVTCDDHSLASAAVIERCGGVLGGRRREPERGGQWVRRYWVTTSRAS